MYLFLVLGKRNKRVQNKLYIKTKSKPQQFVLIDNFYLYLFGFALMLGLMKYSLDRSNVFLSLITLVCCFCVVGTFSFVEGERLQWAPLGGSSAVLVFTSQVYLAVIRKLNYTQKWVKEMNNRGWPKWVLSWVIYPNPGPVPEKAVFDLMVYLLFVNLITLYYLIKMLYFVF